MQQRQELGALGISRSIKRLRRRMQELVSEPAGELLEHLPRRRTAGEQPARPVQLGRAQSIVVALQRSDGRDDRAAVEPTQEASRLLCNEHLCLAYRVGADLQIVLDYVGQVVDAVQEYVVNLSSFGLDIARHRQIDDEHRLVPACLDRALQQSLA